MGVSGEVFNSSGNIACIVTPPCIGYIPAVNLAIIDPGAMGILIEVSYLPIVGSLKRLQIDPPKTAQQYPAISAAARNALFRMYRFVLFC